MVGGTMVPIRFVSEALGADVDWSAAAKTVTVENGDTTINLMIGKTTYLQNGISKTMDTSAVIKNGRTMVPLRLTSEGLGAVVNWQGDTKTIDIKL